MGRLAWSQLRFRAARAVALPAGMLLAATAFTVLTAASQTSRAGVAVPLPAAALLPTRLLRHLPVSHLLAEE